MNPAHRRESSEKKQAPLPPLSPEQLVGLTSMAGGLAHDYNNYLAAILGNSNVLRKGLQDDNPGRRNLDEIECTTLQAIELTNQFLLFSGKAQFAVQPFSLAARIRDLSDDLNRVIGNHVTLETRLDEDMPLIPADAKYVGTLILNLVENASESIVDETGCVMLSIRRHTCGPEDFRHTIIEGNPEVGDYGIIEIRDDGCCICPAISQRVFEPFFTTKLRARGMGLPVALGIARSHGGTLRLTTAPGRGTTVTAFFPYDSPLLDL